MGKEQSRRGRAGLSGFVLSRRLLNAVRDDYFHAIREAAPRRVSAFLEVVLSGAT